MIVTPVYRSKLTDIEHTLLTRTAAATDHPRVFVVPDGLDTGEIRERYPRDRIEITDPEHLVSVHRYNYWLSSSNFYSMWRDFEWILISQLDAVLISDPWSKLPCGDPPWDALGAPWDPPMRVVTVGNRILVRSPAGHDRGPAWVGWAGRRLRVGNGGLSLRRQSAFKTASASLETYAPRTTREHINEDVLWAAFGPRFGARSADVRQARSVFWESIKPATLAPESIPDVAGFHGVDRWPVAARECALERPSQPDRSAPHSGAPR